MYKNNIPRGFLMDKTTTTYALGVDFGTLSVRAVLVNLWDGQIVASETWDS